MSIRMIGHYQVKHRLYMPGLGHLAINVRSLQEKNARSLQKTANKSVRTTDLVTGFRRHLDE